MEHRADLDERLKRTRGRCPVPTPGSRLARPGNRLRDKRRFGWQGRVLDQASQLRPGWSVAVRRCAEELEKDGNDEESRATLNVPLPDARCSILTTMAVWPMCSGGSEREDAFERLIHSLRLDPGYDWAWNMLRGWSTTLKCPEWRENLARELTGQRGRGSQLVAARRDPLREGKTRPAAGGDWAIAGTPVTLSPMISRLNSWRRPAASRMPPRPARRLPGGNRPPIPLRGRAAGVEARRGAVEGAISQMRAALAEDGDDYWGWQNLADWGRDSGKPALDRQGGPR